MGKNSAIEWTTHSWNPWQGCHKVSAGCKNCYMYREKKRYGQNPAVVVRSKDATFYKPLYWHEPAYIFTCSWTDFFIEEADPWRADAWNVIRQTPHLTYQVLTKRPENIADRLPDDWGDGWSNVWLGVSAENQEAADERIPLLLKIQLAVRFVSCEPLLESIDLRLMTVAYHEWRERREAHWDRGIRWIIVGCESGPGHRPMELSWARSLVEQCQVAGVAAFVKQLPIDGHISHNPAEWPEDLQVREFPE